MTITFRVYVGVEFFGFVSDAAHIIPTRDLDLNLYPAVMLDGRREAPSIWQDNSNCVQDWCVSFRLGVRWNDVGDLHVKIMYTNMEKSNLC